MGFFGFMKKGNNNNGNASGMTNVRTNQEVHTSGINLTKEEAVQKLNLRKETLTICLKKNNMENIMARVAVVMDKSGSMFQLYKDGSVQNVIERLLPIAIKFDDNGELDMWLFSDSYKRLRGLTEHDFYGYVNNEILGKKANNFWGGTDYAPVIKDVLKKYVKEEPSNVPTFVIFITDGENFDRNEARQAIIEASKYNVFWQFVGIGDASFKFLKSLDTMEGRTIDNANFFEVNDLNRLTDEDLYNKLLAEYPQWEREAKRIGIIR